MYVVAQHRIKDPEKFFSTTPQEVGENAPPGVQGRQFYPGQDRIAAVCLWEADSIDAVREYVDSATGESSENTYFEVNTEYAMGLPEAAAASA
jgi:hypothetical protein